jgi:hypothetical protein
MLFDILLLWLRMGLIKANSTLGATRRGEESGEKKGM